VLLRLEYFAVKNLPAFTYVLLCTMSTGEILNKPCLSFTLTLQYRSL
jgi:hypothetical protein